MKREINVDGLSQRPHSPQRTRRRRLAILVAAFVSALCVCFAATALGGSLDFFEPASSPVPLADSPGWITAADLDGDGDQDLAVTIYLADSVTILENNGDGKFHEPASSPELVGDQPDAVANAVTAADVDGDGDQDLAVGDALPGTVTILKNNGAGNFHASSTAATGERPESVVAADLDGDGDQDLATANASSADNNVTILKNNGRGSFNEAASSPEPAGGNPDSIAAADLDGDTDQDLVVANGSSDSVTILKNNGGGNFHEPPFSPMQTNDHPVCVVLAELDGDGDQDLVVAARGAINPGVAIYRNNGAGNFIPSSHDEPAGRLPLRIAAADFDGDGDQDLVATNPTGETILKNKGTGEFAKAASSPEPTGNYPGSVVAADFDGHGDQDLATANYLSEDVTILKNR